MNVKKHLAFVLALYPSTRGFGFVVFEGPRAPYDWGVKEIKEKHKNAKTLDAMRELIERYQPEAVAIEAGLICRHIGVAGDFAK